MHCCGAEAPSQRGLHRCEAARTGGSNREQGRLVLCLHRQANGQGTLTQLLAWVTKGLKLTALKLGASVQEPLRQEPLGFGAWLVDPEGTC